MVNEFDVHPDISYKDATGLWWDTYCIRVTVVMPPTYKRKEEFIWEVGRRHPFYAEREKFAREITEPEERFWRTGSENGFYYYFEAADTASQFIDDNRLYVTVVERPTSFDLVETIRDISTSTAMSGMKNVVRPKLYFNKYRYCISLYRLPSYMREDTSDDISEVMERLFNYDPETKHTDDDLRVRFKFPNGNKIYVRDVNDAVLLKMALPAKNITKIEQVVLEDELFADQENISLAA